MMCDWLSGKVTLEASAPPHNPRGPPTDVQSTLNTRWLRWRAGGF